MYSNDVVFDRLCLRLFRKDVKPFLKHLPKDCFKGANTWHIKGFGQWEVRMPKVDAYWVGTAGTAAGAKVKAFEDYVQKALPPEVLEQYEKDMNDIAIKREDAGE